MLEINKPSDEQPTQNALPAEQLPADGEITETEETLEAGEELNEGEEVVEPTDEPEQQV